MQAKRLKPIVIAATAFFVLTAMFARPVAGQWNSPDETANAFWARRVATGSSLAIRDVIVGIGRGAVHPRSFAVVGDALVPGSFPGIFFIYGVLNGFLHIPLWLLTPLLTALAGLALARTLRQLFGERVAFWSAFLFFAHPAVVYYTARGLFHNMLAIDLMIFAAYALATRPIERLRYPHTLVNEVVDAITPESLKPKRLEWDALAAGGLFGLAMITRLSEAVWAVPLLIVLIWSVGPNPWRRLAWVMLGAALPLFLLLEFNAAVYGSPWRTGYVVPTTPVLQVPGTGVVATTPFGFHLMLALRNAYAYGLRLFWWNSVPSVIGVLLWVFGRRGRNRSEQTYLIGTLAACLWLAAFYGSLAVQDRFDALATIGTAYARYFLPAYILALPFAAKAIIALADRVKSAKRFLVECVIVLAVLTINATIHTGDDGLTAVRHTLAINAAKKPALLTAIPTDAILLSARFDKVVFPDRMRIVPVFDAASFDAVAELASYAPVYYYGLDSDTAERDMVMHETALRGLLMAKAASPAAGETLYKITK